jgi:hypothetical protein
MVLVLVLVVVVVVVLVLMSESTVVVVVVVVVGMVIFLVVAVVVVVGVVVMGVVSAATFPETCLTCRRGVFGELYGDNEVLYRAMGGSSSNDLWLLAALDGDWDLVWW